MFFVLRFFRMHTETLDFTPPALQNDNADAMELLNKPMRFFVITFCILSNSLLKAFIEKGTDPAENAFYSNIYFFGAQVLIITFLVFGNWKNFKKGAAFAYALSWISLVFIPIATSSVVFTNWSQMQKSGFKAYMIVCAVAQLCLLANFFMVRTKVVNRV